MRDVHVSNPKYVAPRPTAWLWKLVLVIIVVTGGFVALMARDLPDPSAKAAIRKLIAFALVAVGVCAISATSGRWMHR
jgi:hypothetical protein